MKARSLVSLFAFLLLLAGCGDSGGGTTGSAAAATSTTTAAAITTLPPASSTTLATTTTTRAPAEMPDLSLVVDCEGLVDAALAATQIMLDGLAGLTLNELAELGNDLPPSVLAVEDFGVAMEQRGEDLECDSADLEAGLFARIDELEASGVVAELILEGLKDEAPGVGGSAAPAGPPEGVEYFDVADASHTEDSVEYPQDPPVGGPHRPAWQNCGFYSEPVVTEHAVHSLEHGAVWITYDSAFATGIELEALRDLGAEDKVLVSPYDGLGDTPVVASVWGAQMRFESALDPELRQFVDALRDATAPEPGAACQGGTGEPE